MSLPKSLTTVTPFSKFLALSMLVVFPILGFHLGQLSQKYTNPPPAQLVPMENNGIDIPDQNIPLTVSFYIVGKPYHLAEKYTAATKVDEIVLVDEQTDHAEYVLYTGEYGHSFGNILISPDATHYLVGDGVGDYLRTLLLGISVTASGKIVPETPQQNFLTSNHGIEIPIAWLDDKTLLIKTNSLSVTLKPEENRFWAASVTNPASRKQINWP